MTTIVFFIATFAILIAVVILYFKPYDYGGENTGLERIEIDSTTIWDPSDDTHWRTVKVRPGLIACEHATAIQEQVYLSREVPALPLANCGETDCRCHYVFHEDRRSGLDRRAELDRLGSLLGGTREDRRRNPGRRAGDLVTT